ncbi:hypothetical protein ACFLVI_03990 [Chloroflexota bacterium]
MLVRIVGDGVNSEVFAGVGVMVNVGLGFAPERASELQDSNVNIDTIKNNDSNNCCALFIRHL